MTAIKEGEWFEFCDPYFGEGRILRAVILPSYRANPHFEYLVKSYKEALAKALKK